MFSDETSVSALLQKVLSHSQANQTEAVYLGTESALTRFANNGIHQNVAESNHELRVRAVLGKRVGVATTNRLDDESLRRVTEQALEIARLQPENQNFTHCQNRSRSFLLLAIVSALPNSARRSALSASVSLFAWPGNVALKRRELSQPMPPRWRLPTPWASMPMSRARTPNVTPLLWRMNEGLATPSVWLPMPLPSMLKRWRVRR